MTVPLPVPPATYDTDSNIQEIISLLEKNVCVRHTQTLMTEKVNNSTQTEPDCRMELFEVILKKIEELETKFDITGMEQRLSTRIDSLEGKLNTSEPERDIFTFCDDIPTTPIRKTPLSRPTTPMTPKLKCEINDIGFWKLTPSEILGTDTETVKELAGRRSVLHNPVLDGHMIESVKKSV